MSIATNILLGTVLDTDDPDNLGRIQVSLHGFATAHTTPWLHVVQPFTGVSHGAFFIPEKDTTVVILRGFGSSHYGLFVIGALYDSHTNKPAITALKENNLKEIRTKAGHALTFDDTADAEMITIVSSDEKLKIEIDVANGKVAITGDKEVSITSTEKVSVTCDTMEIAASTSLTIKDTPTVKVDGAKEVTITGSDSVTVDGGKSLTLTAKAIEMK